MPCSRAANPTAADLQACVAVAEAIYAWVESGHQSNILQDVANAWQPILSKPELRSWLISKIANPRAIPHSASMPGNNENEK